MTQAEAKLAGRGKHSFAAVILRSEKDRVIGLVFFDSSTNEAFGPSSESHEWQSFEAMVVESCKTSGLNALLEVLEIELIKKSAQISFYVR